MYVGVPAVVLGKISDIVDHKEGAVNFCLQKSRNLMDRIGIYIAIILLSARFSNIGILVTGKQFAYQYCQCYNIDDRYFK